MQGHCGACFYQRRLRAATALPGGGTVLKFGMRSRLCMVCQRRFLGGVRMGNRAGNYFPKRLRFQLRRLNVLPVSALLPAWDFPSGCTGFIGSSTGKVAAVIEACCAPRDVGV